MISRSDDDRRSDEQPPGLSRRQVLGLGAAAVAATFVPTDTAGAVGRPARAVRSGVQAVEPLEPDIHPRVDWAGELGVKGEIVAEDDVRFLLVHHTASTNAYGPDDVVDEIRGFYDFHTGPEKGWPDVAYNFFVDRYGGIWEGRAGSIDGPVRGDATGGSQGFALLCALIGNHAEEAPTAEQQESLVRLLAWLAERHGIDTAPDAEVSFISRGSSRWPEGTEVIASTISGHRDMSTTTCPGDFAYPLLATEIPSAVSLVRVSLAVDSTSTSTTTSTATTTSTSTSTSTSTPATAAADGSQAAAVPTAEPTGTSSDDGRSIPLLIAGGVAGLVAAAGAVVTRLVGRQPDG